ncbi:hypothetical protein [Priestia taiwanensis]|uniref:Uncharacterized protein n=1 Tax=Priestia taiwanensis TaxID=1347902 RepID=A0A917ES34_9BACI|nr:hypothetical protein [Priestia taiwanensis]MBM7364207.1 putative membrane protein [Priestia taiwanensis]GGE72515.1 hypothetical protein GCM10007140_23050 [Priestia taiwanensis]
MKQKTREKWWQVSYGYSSKTRLYSFLTTFSLIVGIIFGVKHWLFNFRVIGIEDGILPLSLASATLFFMIYRRLAKEEYEEKDLGYPGIWEK